MTVINMALFFVRFVKTTMSAFFFLHQFLGTVQQTTPGGDGGSGGGGYDSIWPLASAAAVIQAAYGTFEHNLVCFHLCLTEFFFFL